MVQSSLGSRSFVVSMIVIWRSVGYDFHQLLLIILSVADCLEL